MINKKLGRPTEYTEDMAKKICRAISINPMGIRKICKLYQDFPDPSTIFEWRLDHTDFAEWYARAKQEQAEVMFDDMLDVALDGTSDWYTDTKGNKRVDNECVQRSKLIVDTYKYQCERLSPKKYGSKSIFEAEGSLLEKFIDKL